MAAPPLPRRPTSFIGRQRELDGIEAALRNAPLVTLTGVGGVGKTESTVIEYLRARELLLVVDNCQHLLDAVARPRVSVLATSREVLGIEGERILTLPPLDTAGTVESSRSQTSSAPTSTRVARSST